MMKPSLFGLSVALAAWAPAAIGQGLVVLSLPEDPWLLGRHGDGDSNGCRIGGDRHLVFHSAAANLVADDGNASRDVFVRDLLSGDIERVSVANDGGERSGDSSHGDIDASGRYVAFESFAELDQGARSPGVRDIYLRDRLAGSTRLLSRTPTVSGHFGSGAPRIDAAGTHVVFESNATALVAGDSNHCSDIFLYRIADDSLWRVSTDADGNEADGCSYHADVSDGGGTVVFESLADNLVAGDGNARSDVFRKSLTDGRIELLSADPGGAAGNRHSQQASISADGSRVVFASAASNLVPGDSNTQSDIFIWRNDLAPALLRLNLPPGGGQANAPSEQPAIARSGGQVGFLSRAGNLLPGQLTGLQQPFAVGSDGSGLRALLHVAGSSATLPRPDSGGLSLCVESTSLLVPDDGNGALSDIYVNAAGVWSLASLAGQAQPLHAGNGDSTQPELGGDGRYVVFMSVAGSLDGEGFDGEGHADVHWLDRPLGLIERHPVGIGGLPADGDSSTPAVSDDGRYLVFASHARNLVPGDTDDNSDVLRLDRHSGELLQLSRGTVASSGDSDQPHIDGSGSHVVFRSDDPGLTQADGNAADDVLLWRDGAPLQRLSDAPDGTQADADSWAPRLSRDASHAVFVSAAGNLEPGRGDDGVNDIYLRGIDDGKLRRISRTTDGNAANGDSTSADVANGGSAVAFITMADNIADDDRPGPDALLWRRDAAKVTAISRNLPAAFTVQPEPVRISADGRFVAFVTRRQIGSSFPRDVWRYDADSDSLLLLSQRTDGDDHLGLVDGIAIADGGAVAFASNDDALTDDPRNGHYDVLLAAPQGDAGSIELFPAAVSIGENACSVVILVRRDGGSGGQVSADYTTIAGSAGSPLDYQARFGTVTFDDGDSDVRALQVLIHNDAVAEGDEQFTVALSNPQGGVALGPVAITTVTIFDDETGDNIFVHGFELISTCPN